MKNSVQQKFVQFNLLFVLLLTFYSSQTNLNAQTVRWVNNQAELRPSTVTVQGNSYSTAATTYTDIQVAINSSNSGDIILITDGTYRNPQESISTACSLFGTAQDSLLYLEVFKSNLLIISETGDYRTSSARLVGYGFSSRNNNILNIQGLHMDSIRVNAFWASNGYGYGPAANSTIKNNKVTNTRGHGIKTDSDGSTTVNRGTWVIEGNYFENIGFYNGNGNCLTPAAVSAIWLAEAGQYFTIKGNVIKNTKWAGILCDGYGGFGSTNGSVIIRENQINTTVSSGIQVGISSANFYYPYNAIIKKNKIENANTSADTTIGAVTILHSNVRGVIIDSNHITSSHNGIAIDIAGWQDSPDTTYINYNNFCSLSGGFAIHHTRWASTCCSTADNLLKYDIENNFWGDASGPTYSTNPSGTGEALQKDATQSGNDFDFLPFATTPFAIDTFNVNSCPVVSPNNSMSFNGTNQYVEVPYSAALNSATFTFEAYAKVDGNTGTFQSVMTNRQSGSAGYVFYYNPGNKWIYWGNGGDKNILGIPATLGQWYHLAVTHDGTTHKFYIDGELVGTKVAANFVNTTNELRIGAGETGSSPQYYFKGEIDEVRFWNVAKTQSEIQANMNIALSPQTNLVAYYNFDQSSGALQDQSGNGHHGTLYGNPSYIASTVPCMTAFTTVNTSLVCNSDNNGQITASASSSSTPFSYIWSNSATSTSISGLSAGTYTVTVTDNVGCIDSASVVLNQPSAVVANISQTNITCNAGSNGSITDSVTGGTSPYSYLWSIGATTASISGLSAGVYNTTITDANGCTGIFSATITEPTAITTSISAKSDATTTGGSDGSTTVTSSGGTGAYSYIWSNGATTTTISGLSSGTYTVSVSDDNGCGPVATSVVISEPVNLSISKAGPGNALEFDGVDDYVNIPHDNTLNITSPFTVELYARTTGTLNRVLIEKNSNSGFSVQRFSGGQWGMNINGTISSSTISQNDGEWHHVAITYVSPGVGQIFIDGIDVTQTNATGTPNLSTGNLYIGGRAASLGINGGIDEVRIWNTTLSQTEIRDWMTKKITSSHPQIASLVSYYRFDENTGTTLSDLVGGNDGTLINSPTWVTSGAAIGDSSSFTYGGTSISQTMANGNVVTANNFTGSPTGIQIYTISDTATNSIFPTGFSAIDSASYIGVKMIGGSTYDLSIDISGNTDLASSPNKEKLRVLKRENGADGT